MKDTYFFIIIGIFNIVFRKQLGEMASVKNPENKEIMTIVALVAGILLIVVGLLEVFNVIHFVN